MDYNRVPLPVCLVSEDDCTIIWANLIFSAVTGLAQEQLTRVPFREIFLSRAGRSDERFRELLTLSEQNAVSVRLNGSSTILSRRFLAMQQNRDHYLFRSEKISEGRILYFERVINPLIKDFMMNMRDFLIFADDRQVIHDNTSNQILQHAGNGRSLIGQTLSEFMGEQACAAFLASVSEARAYVHQAAISKRPWESLYVDDLTDPNHWHSQQDGPKHWSFLHGQGARFDSQEETGMLYLNKNFDFASRDFALTLSLVHDGRSRFALMFNQRQASAWDLGGYNCGPHFRKESCFLGLKKDGRACYFSPQISYPGKEMSFRIEKCGGLVSMFINRVKVGEYPDIEPISNTFPVVGFLSYGATLFTGFEIETRASEFLEGSSYRPYRVRLPGIASRIYQISLFPVENWEDQPSINEALWFSDVTDLAIAEETKSELSRKNQFLTAKNYFGFVGGNAKIIEIVERIERVVDSDATLFVSGPTGSGKAVLAEAIHRRSRRRDHPFVTVDCSTIPEALLESELFGHEKGAFTGAIELHKGKFELANRGTIFLDEVGNLTHSAQAKLLLFLEQHAFSRVGGRQLIEVDIRIVAATNADLWDMVRAGRFREDLFYRIHVIPLQLPSLAERIDDIPLLLDYLISKINQNHHLAITGIERPVLDALLTHHWPGNVRELQSVILNLALQQREGKISEVPLFRQSKDKTRSARVILPDQERHDAILALARESKWFSSRECQSILSVSLTTIQRDLRKLCKLGHLKSSGKGPSVRYLLNV